MRTSLVMIAFVASCSGSRSHEEPAPPAQQPPAPAPVEPAPTPVEVAPPPTDAAQPTASSAGDRRYFSDCSFTNPVSRDPCALQATTTRGLQKCADLGVKPGQACDASAASCYLEKDCGNGRRAVSDYLVCATETPGRCHTKSSRRYKHGVRYLSAAELHQLARQIERLPLAHYRYDDQIGGDERLGLLTEDATGAPFVADDGTSVDLYALLAASIAAIQTQDERIRALEQQLQRCAK